VSPACEALSIRLKPQKEKYQDSGSIPERAPSGEGISQELVMKLSGKIFND